MIRYVVDNALCFKAHLHYKWLLSKAKGSQGFGGHIDRGCCVDCELAQDRLYIGVGKSIVNGRNLYGCLRKGFSSLVHHQVSQCTWAEGADYAPDSRCASIVFGKIELGHTLLWQHVLRQMYSDVLRSHAA